MSMSNGRFRRAPGCALILFVLCAQAGFGQQVPRRQPRRAPQRSATRRGRVTSAFVPNRYIIFLQDPPVASRYTERAAMRTTEALAYQRQIVSRQQALITELSNRNIRVTGSVNTLLNAVFVAVGPDRLAEIRGLPGVIGVMPERAMKKSLNKATALANAPAAWANPSIGGQSNAGNGVKIAIFDTGIDQTHPAFSGSGFTMPSGFPKCNTPPAFTGITDPLYDCKNFTNNKVIVARSYVPEIVAAPSTTGQAPPAATSMPDDYSARDRDGHGTAVASAAAAEQNTGGSIAFSGMAPKAWLGNYKIWGSDGVNDNPPESVWIQALEDALNDGMDVANMSSGGPAYTGALDTTACGNAAGVPCDPLAAAYENAAKAGMVITVAAGNAGDNAYAIGENYPYFNSVVSPATAPSVIGVGGTLNSHALASVVTVNASNAPSTLQGIPAVASDGLFGCSELSLGCVASAGFASQVVDVTTPAVGDTDGLACSALPGGSLGGKIALIQRGTCTFDTKVMNASNAGAAGVILYMADSSAPIPPEYLIADPTDFYFGPVVMIPLSAGQALKTFVDANPSALVTIDTSGQEQSVSAANELVSFSSFGPTPDGLIKPDLVATAGYDGAVFGSIDNNDGYLPPPHGLYLAAQNYDQNGDLYSETRYVGADGTSFAAPLVAGAAALVKQAHPTWSAAEIKSALLNYSAQDVTSDTLGDTVDVEWLGAGRLDANAAVNATVTAVPSTLSFGFLKSGVALPIPISVTLTNRGSNSVTLAVAVATGVAASGTTVAPSKPSITLAAGANTTFTVTLSGAVPAAGEYNGAITLQSSNPAVNMRIPYMFIVGDGVVVNAVPGSCCYGQVGADLGAVPIQVTDDYGAPVSSVSVTFSASPRGALTFKSVTGVPGTTANGAQPFTPPACSPSSGATVVCPTNQYGWAWVEVTGGTTATSSATLIASVPPTYATPNDIEFGVTLIPPPSITAGGIANAGSYVTTIAPGSYVAIFGSNLVDPNYLYSSTGDTTPYSILPLSLDYVTVSFDAPKTGSLPAISVPGYVYFVSPGQVNLYLPWELENYPSAQVKVTYFESMFSSPMTVNLANYSPAFLMNSGTVADARDNTTGALITSSNPATAGEILQLYCNGLGPVTNQPVSGEPALGGSNLSYTTSAVTVTIGGKQALVYANSLGFLAPPFVGLYQVDVQVPAGLSSGPQSITISVGGQTSPTTVAGSTVSLPIK